MILAPEDCSCSIVDEGLSVVNTPICAGTILFLALVDSFLKGRCDISSPCKRVTPVANVSETYDFIIVGAGTAGSVLASRLSEVEDFKVLLIEAGGVDPTASKAPGFYRNFAKTAVDWQYRTEPDNYCLDQNGKGCFWPRGKTLGGTAVLNGMMFHKGHKEDYNNWVNAGAVGWSWEENLPYFNMLEGNQEIGTVVSAENHSSNGTMPVKRFNYQPPFLYELLNAINETGFPIIQDMNDPDTPEGFTIAQAFNLDGQRYTTARAYLSPRDNLDVALNSLVSKVLTETVDDVTQAVGIEYYDDSGNLNTVYASKEVILSAGALNTPQILLLSGIGPAESLESLDIPVVMDLPVGQNLQNHIGMVLNYVITDIENVQTLDWSVFTEYMLNRDGPMSSTGITQLTGLLYSSLANKTLFQPDLQFFFNGFYAECSETGEVCEKVGEDYARGTNISTSAVVILPRSCGNLTLNSVDPFDAPIFNPNYFSHPDDMVMLKDAARIVQQIFETDVMKNSFGVELDSTFMEACADYETWSDDWIECTARMYTDPQNHQLGTAAIGSVIDPYLRVYNISNLRVMDASSMPSSLTGNPEAAIIMVAERGSAFIKEDWNN